MRLTDMKPNFVSLTEIDQRQTFEIYSENRLRDLVQPIVQPKTKGKNKKGGKQISLTTEQFNLLKQLGLL